jgi:hypothetical protein
MHFRFQFTLTRIYNLGEFQNETAEGDDNNTAQSSMKGLKSQVYTR